MKVPLLDLKLQYQSIKSEILAATNEVFDSQYFILGPKVKELEEAGAEYCQTRFALGVSSGTDALIIALMAADIGPGDLVITTPYTFFATAGAVFRLGAKAVFVDIDPKTYNISVAGIEHALTRMTASQKDRLKAIIPVHLYGQCADMNQIRNLAEKNGLTVIEDAAQAIGSEFDGARAGSMGAMGCFSFFPSKNLGAFGDGGLVTTNSETLIERLRVLRVHGSKPKYYHRMVGGNFRLDALQAAIVLVKLKYLDDWTAGRQQNAAKYRRLFAEAGLEEFVELPLEKESRHIYNQFVLKVSGDRDQLRQSLAESGIGTEVYYPVALHMQECFADLGYREGDFPVAEEAARQGLALPIYPELTDDQLEYVVKQIGKFYR